MSTRRAPPSHPSHYSGNPGNHKNRYFIYIIAALVSVMVAFLLPVFSDVDSNLAIGVVFLVLVMILLVEVLTPAKAPARRPPAHVKHRRDRSHSGPGGKTSGARSGQAKSASPKTGPKPTAKSRPAGKRPAPKKKPAKVVIEAGEEAEETVTKKAVAGVARPSTTGVRKEMERRRIISYPQEASGGKYGDCFIVVDRNTVLKVRTLLARSCRMCKNRDSCWEKYKDVMDYESFMNNFECLEEETDVIADEEEATVEEVTLEDDTQIVEDYGVDEDYEEEYVEEDGEEEEYTESEEEVEEYAGEEGWEEETSWE